MAALKHFEARKLCNLVNWFLFETRDHKLEAGYINHHSKDYDYVEINGRWRKTSDIFLIEILQGPQGETPYPNAGRG